MRRLVCLLILVSIFSCQNNPPEPTELYNNYRKSVVLIQNVYYFKTTLDNGLEMFYTIENNEPILYDNENEAIENASVSFGTGFFISESGELATNRHVIYPVINNRLISDKISDYYVNLKSNINNAIEEAKNDKVKIAEYYNENFTYLDEDEKQSLKDEFSEKEGKISDLNDLLKEVSFNYKQNTTELKRVFLGIAFDDTHVTAQTDFKECVAIKKSDIEEYDLAIIQLKDKSTPTFVSKMLSLNNISNAEQPKLNDDVYMIGFNHGISLANTDNGIKSQFTHGTITQDPDNKKILYSIPTLPGSSGSPIIDKWGNLVAVNFAKTGDFQGFSFGVPSLALLNLYSNNNTVFANEKSLDVVNSGQRFQATSNKSEKSDYSEVIRDFLKAEEKRDLKEITSYFSPRFTRYYDLNNPTYSQLQNRYEYLWGFTSDPKNNVKSIKKINDFTYDLNTTYTYYNQKKAQDFSVESVVRFLFDSDGKIIETYGIN